MTQANSSQDFQPPDLEKYMAIVLEKRASNASLQVKNTTLSGHIPFVLTAHIIVLICYLFLQQKSDSEHKFQTGDEGSDRHDNDSPTQNLNTDGDQDGVRVEDLVLSMESRTASAKDKEGDDDYSDEISDFSAADLDYAEW